MCTGTLRVDRTAELFPSFSAVWAGGFPFGLTCVLAIIFNPIAFGGTFWSVVRMHAKFFEVLEMNGSIVA